MKKIRAVWVRGLVLMLLSVMGVQPAWSASAQELLEGFIKNRVFAEGRFSQVVLSNTGVQKQKGNGEFAFSRPGKFRWEVQKPYPQLIVTDGVNLVSYDPDLQQATKKKMGNLMEATPAALLFGSQDIHALFEFKDEGLKDGKQWLQARPRNKETLFEFIRIGFKDSLPSVVSIHDAMGQVTHLELSDWSFNTKRPTAFFGFKPPQGVDVIESQ